MITPVEIRSQQFKKGFRGYKSEEVKNFLSQVTDDYESLYAENIKLKEEIKRLEQELDKYKKIEDAMNNSLILAQQTAENWKMNARKEAELLLEDSKKRIAHIFMVYQDVIKRLNMFSSEMKAQVTGQLEFIELNQKKVDELSGFFYGKDIKNLIENLNTINLEENSDVESRQS